MLYLETGYSGKKQVKLAYKFQEVRSDFQKVLKIGVLI